MPSPSRVRWIRALLLTLFLASAAVITYLLGFGGSTSVVAPDGAAPEEIVAEASGEFRIRSTDCRQAVTQLDRNLFELEAQECAVNQQGQVSLVRPTVRLDREDGIYVIDGAAGTYDERDQSALIEGDVRVVGPQPFRLDTDFLRLINQGQVVVAADGSEFELGNVGRGTSQTLRMDLETSDILMNRGVTIRSTPSSPTPFGLDAELLRYVDERRMLRAQGGVDLTYGPHSLHALRLSVYLDDITDQVRFIRGLWEIRGRLRADTTPQELMAGDSAPPGDPAGPSGGTFIDYQGLSVALQIDEVGLITGFELSGTRGQPVVLVTSADGGPAQPRRRLRAAQVQGTFTEGRISQAQAVGAVVFEELPADPGDDTFLRRATGESSTTLFDQTGNVVRIDLESDVTLADGRIEAEAERANLLILQERTELYGDPRVEVRGQQGLLTSPRMTYNQGAQVLEARGGVRARLDDQQTLGATVALGGGDGPVYVESAEAAFRQSDDGFLFKGEVRAWRGKNLLLCDQLRGQGEGELLTAVGNVRTVWYPEADAETPPEREGPLEVRAGYLEYGGAEDSFLLYEEDVRARQQAGTMNCATLRMDLDESNEVETMLCDGGGKRVTLVDEAVGRRIEGDRMVFRPGRDELEVCGDVRAEEGRRSFRGPHLLYDLETGSFSAGGSADSADGAGADAAAPCAVP